MQSIESLQAQVQRTFTVIAMKRSEVLELPVQEVVKMNHEFPFAAHELFNLAVANL